MPIGYRSVGASKIAWTGSGGGITGTRITTNMRGTAGRVRARM